jgi:serine/threonine-protein kinase RsbW
MKTLYSTTSARCTGFCRDIPSCLANVDNICKDAQNLLIMQQQTQHTFAVDLLLREFISNAIIHGHGMDKCKQVHITVKIGHKWIKLQIADKGPGFNWRIRCQSIPSENATSGRGLYIGTLYSQRMQFNRTGNQVTLWIRKHN